jgi:RHS repeat-associated protein
VYEKQGAQAIALKETHLYGSSRLGLVNPVTKKTISLGGPLHAKVYTFTRGEKFFELTNHLGNVLAVITDKKLPVKQTTGNEISHWLADVVSATSYYPFGMAMPGRTYSSGGYRYGFNGKENDNEVKGTGNQQDYGMRIYDPRLGRFLSVDPLSIGYPMLTPYQFASNRPIDGIDLVGLEFYKNNNCYVRLHLTYSPKLRLVTQGNVLFRIDEKILPAGLNEDIKKASTCVNCIGWNTAQVATFKLIYKPISTQSDAEFKDVEVEPGSTVGMIEGKNIKIPQNKKDLRSIEKSKEFFNLPMASRYAALNRVSIYVDVATKLLEGYWGYYSNSIVNDSKNQAKKAGQISVIINNALNIRGLIPEKYKNEKSLNSLGNYLLFGETPKTENYNMKLGDYEIDQGLINLGNFLWEVIKYGQEQERLKELDEQYQREKKPKRDNL